MRINITNSTEVGFAVLRLISSLKTQYGRVTLSKVLKGSKSKDLMQKHLDSNEYFSCLEAFTLEQIENIIDQLIKQEYLKHLNVGTDYPIEVIGLTEKSVDAVNSKQEINLELPKIYAPEFIAATEIHPLDKKIIDEYYTVKVELNRLQKRETELKEYIKKFMLENNLPKIHTEKIELICRKIERIFYPKEKIEEFVPEDIKEKIREITETVVLSSKIRE